MTDELAAAREELERAREAIENGFMTDGAHAALERLHSAVGLLIEWLERQDGGVR